MVKPHLPFTVGQYTEAQTFLKGYRGAWFRCKITKIVGTNKCMKLALEYYDFPEEKIEWKRPYSKRSRYDTKEHLMVRPPYPPFNHEGELPDITNGSEVVVVVNDVWKEGDLVDWWRDSCYWSGKLTKKLTEDTFQIDLWPDPLGEGSSYEASCKDLRPSLVWSPKRGWTFPLSEGGKSVSPCARLIHPKEQQVHSVDEGRKGNVVTTEVPEEHRPSNSRTSKEGCSGRFLSDQSRGIASNRDGKDHRINEGPSKLARSMKGSQASPTAQAEHKPSNSGMSKGGCPGSFRKNPPGGIASNHNGKEHLADKPSPKGARSDGITLNSTHPDTTVAARSKGGTESNHNGKNHLLADEPSSKRVRIEGIPLNSTHSDTIDAAILDLEELVCRVKWIKSILQNGTALSKSPKWTCTAE